MTIYDNEVPSVKEKIIEFSGKLKEAFLIMHFL